MLLENVLELILAFIFGFVTTWFIVRDVSFDDKKPEICDKQETILRLAEQHGHNEKISREIKGYSLEMIKEGHYEYGDVLQTLMKKDKNDKA